MRAEDIKSVIASGALIVDVRTVREYSTGNIEGSLNIPLNTIEDAMSWLVKDVPVVVVCESGARSGVAKKTLEANGYTQVYNGGRWNNLGNSHAHYNDKENYP